MKFTKKIILSMIILLAIGFSSVYATEGTVTTDGVRVRKEPNTNSEIVTVLNASAQVEILEELDGWYKIKYDSLGTYEGYMSKDFVKSKTDSSSTSTPVPTQTPTPVSTPEVQESPAVSKPTEVPTTNEEQQEDLLGDRKVNGNTKVYVLPSITSKIKDSINANTSVTVQEIAGNFAYIKYNDKYGWVRKSLLQTTTETPTEQNTETNNEENNNNTSSQTYAEQRKGYINVTQAIVREKATTASEMVTAFDLNDEVTIIGEEGDFYKILVDGKECYIAKRLISDTKQQVTNRSSEPRNSESRNEKTEVTTEENTVVVEEKKEEVKEEPKVETTNQVQSTVPTSSVGEKIAEMAKQYIGYKYVYGGSNPTTGFDCSGLVYYICGQLGYQVYRTADTQVNNGVAVDKSNLQPGDLVFFTNYITFSEIGHVGIYIGNNQFVHASTTTTGVIVSSLDEPNYVKRYVTARRIGV